MNMRLYRLIPVFVVSLACLLHAQSPENEDLQKGLSETNGSPVEMVRILERHLKKYPKSAQRQDIEKTIAKAAVELRDERRIIEYGERVLKRDDSDLQILDRVTAALLSWSTTNPERATRALAYARRFETLIKPLENNPVEPREAAKHKEEIDRGLSRALLFQARALGILGKYDDAVPLARKSFECYPSENPAHEIGRWLAKAGRHAEAVTPLADALMIPDARAAESDRAEDRKELGESWKLSHNGSLAGLGDLLLAAYDRTSAIVAERTRKLRELDPNRDVTNPYQFTISKLGGGRLKLAELKGKVIVLDFWATWCGPCKAQHPLYEEVKKRFEKRSDVVFLAISADEDPSLVPAFLEQNHWSKNVYFEDGLARLMSVTSIPSTVVFDKEGQIASRMNGYLPERFVDMLSERIEGALGEESVK